MRNWETCDADEIKLLTKHYTKGRQGLKINKIVLHHNAGNLSIQDCYNVWQTREASAHYQVQSDGRVGQLVWDYDTAWHAGNWSANATSIGIEHADISTSPWQISAQCLENGAHLVAALCKLYGLGRPTWMKNVFPHSYFYATACPCSIRDSQNSDYMKRAGDWYDAMTGVVKPQNQTRTMEEYPMIKSEIVVDGDVSSVEVHVPWGINNSVGMTLTRTGNVVTANGAGGIKAGSAQWAKANETIPEGFRPTSLSTITLTGGRAALLVQPDGSIYYDGDARDCTTHISGAWVTKDNQPE